MSLNKVGGILSVGLNGINSPVTQVEYLVVAGGGGGAASFGGGGGAGGLLTGIGYPVTAGSAITVTIGAGGAGGGPPGALADGSTGSNSVFGNITTLGGGAGGTNGGGSGGQPMNRGDASSQPISSVRNEENSFVRMQNAQAMQFLT